MSKRTENWVEVQGTDHLYEVSDRGRVRRVGSGSCLKQHEQNRGYKQVIISVHGKTRLLLVHRLVAMAFLPNPDNLPQVNHLDECKTNNDAANLEWCTAKQNICHGTGIERSRKSRSMGVMQYIGDDITAEVAYYPSANEAARQTGIPQGNISRVCRGEGLTAGGYQWMYI